MKNIDDNKENIIQEKQTKSTVITNQETIDAMNESKIQLNYPENGATTIEEFWSDLL